eukprot:5837053-Heterocapsa_arctica.AAC.1
MTIVIASRNWFQNIYPHILRARYRSLPSGVSRFCGSIRGSSTWDTGTSSTRHAEPARARRAVDSRALGRARR